MSDQRTSLTREQHQLIDTRNYEKSVVRHVLLTHSRNLLQNMDAILDGVDFTKVDLAAQRLSKRLNINVSVVKEGNKPLSIKHFPQK